MATIRHTGGWSGVFRPADAHPPFEVAFHDGLAYVPDVMFGTDQFQVYYLKELAEGVWVLEPPTPAKPKREIVPEPEPEPVKVKAARKPKAKLVVTPVRSVAKLTPPKGR
jgi:hypothetical protein